MEFKEATNALDAMEVKEEYWPNAVNEMDHSGRFFFLFVFARRRILRQTKMTGRT